MAEFWAMSRVTLHLAGDASSSKWSQVTPLAEQFEMVQYFELFGTAWLRAACDPWPRDRWGQLWSTGSSRCLSKWLSNNPNFITIIGLLAESPIPLLEFTSWYHSFLSLTVLEIANCRNVPLTVYLVCPNLREVHLLNVIVLESRGDEYPDLQCSDRELPALECLKYCISGILVKQMITPPSKFSIGVVDWSRLRVLGVYLKDMEGMVCLQPILDAACNTLVELYLTHRRVSPDIAGKMVILIDMTRIWQVIQQDQLCLAGFIIDVRHLPYLHTLAIHSYIWCDPQELVVLLDIKPVLSTIPKANHLTKLLLDLFVSYEQPINVRPEEDWVGMCDEIVSISAGKWLQLDLEMTIISIPSPLRQTRTEWIVQVHRGKAIQLPKYLYPLLTLASSFSDIFLSLVPLRGDLIEPNISLISCNRRMYLVKLGTALHFAKGRIDYWLHYLIRQLHSLGYV